MKKENCVFCKSQGYIYDTKRFIEKECEKCEGLGFFYVKSEDKEKKEDVYRSIDTSSVQRSSDDNIFDNLGEMERPVKTKKSGRPKKSM